MLTILEQNGAMSRVAGVDLAKINKIQRDSTSPGHMRLVLRLLADQTMVALAAGTMVAQLDLPGQDIMGVAAMEPSMVDI